MNKISHVVRDVYVALNSIIFLIFLLKMPKWKTTRWIATIMNQRHEQSDKELVSINRMQHRNSTKTWYQKLKETPKLTVFAIVTFCYAICDFFLFLSSEHNRSLQDILTTITIYLSYIFYLSVVFLFDICYNEVILKTCSFFYNVLTFMIGGVLCFWFSLTFEPVYELTKRCHKEEALTANQPNQTVSKTLHFVVKEMHSFFEPFAIEFMMFTIAVLIKLWSTMSEKENVMKTEGISATYGIPTLGNESLNCNTTNEAGVAYSDSADDDGVTNDNAAGGARTMNSYLADGAGEINGNAADEAGITNDFAAKIAGTIKDNGAVSAIVTNNNAVVGATAAKWTTAVGAGVINCDAAAGAAITIGNAAVAAGARSIKGYTAVETEAINGISAVGAVHHNIEASRAASILEDQTCQSRLKKRMKCVLAAMSFLVLAFYVFSYIIFSDHFESSFKIKIVGEIYIWESIKFGLYLPQCIFIAFSIFSWRASSTCKLHWTISFTTRDYFLLGLTVVVYFIYLLRFFCALTLLIYSDQPFDIRDRPTNGEVVAVLLFTIFGILQVYAQSRYLLMTSGQQASAVNIGHIHWYVLMYTMLLNVAEWLMNSLGHVWSVESEENLFPLFTYVFGVFTTDLIKVLCYPLITFYNFHCAILTYEIIKEMKEFSQRSVYVTSNQF